MRFSALGIEPFRLVHSLAVVLPTHHCNARPFESCVRTVEENLEPSKGDVPPQRGVRQKGCISTPLCTIDAFGHLLRNGICLVQHVGWESCLNRLNFVFGGRFRMGNHFSLDFSSRVNSVRNLRWMTLQGTWSIIVANILLLIPYWKPSLLEPPGLNCCYISVQLYIAFWMSPWSSSFGDIFVLELIGFALGSVPAAVMATNAVVLLLSWFAVFGVVLLRVSTETDFAVAEPDTVANPRTLVFTNILFTGLKIGTR